MIEITPITTLIDKIHPKFLYIPKSLWEKITEENQEEIKHSYYIILYKYGECFIYCPSSDAEYVYLRQFANGGYYFESLYGLYEFYSIFDTLNGGKKINDKIND